jgi:hypothetical protein
MPIVKAVVTTLYLLRLFLGGLEVRGETSLGCRTPISHAVPLRSGTGAGTPVRASCSSGMAS